MPRSQTVLPAKLRRIRDVARDLKRELARPTYRAGPAVQALATFIEDEAEMALQLLEPLNREPVR